MNAPYSFPLGTRAPVYDLSSDLEALERVASIDAAKPEAPDLYFAREWRNCKTCAGLFPPTSHGQNECFGCRNRPNW